ncbi:hypothetical protein ETAA8_31360 [Anatilimnocola aggregata]|uniref:DUF1275 domain-containing protein n=1 Tax=Anatilimnocola aggregata TaxID=2528021 RepID=A0A517YCT1_9BACT|nr:YoaK family protein [Anatilimnocola aggregata]QDU28044.1 hypothetical protein ETAA8_31360 [Anatilimnocola aggregata]
MNMTLHTPETIYSPRHVPSWLLLSAAAGIVNGFAFLTCQQFVTHVTGTLTRLGIEWWHAALAFEYAAVLIAFLAGAIAATITIQLRANSSSRTRWATPLVAVAMLLSGVAIGGGAGWFGVFGGTVASDPPPVVLLSILAFSMGMQNAAVASTTGLAVRTTHLTGPMTDLGIHLGTAVLSRHHERWKALRGAALRGGKVLAFVFGAAISVSLSATLGYFILLPAALFVTVAAALSFLPDWSPSDYPYSVRCRGSKHQRDSSASRIAVN